MLKSCPSCAYIGNDGEHVCPFCKADLALGRPRRTEEQTIEPTSVRSIGGTRSAFHGLAVCFYKSEQDTKDDQSFVSQRSVFQF